MLLVPKTNKLKKTGSLADSRNMKHVNVVRLKTNKSWPSYNELSHPQVLLNPLHTWPLRFYIAHIIQLLCCQSLQYSPEMKKKKKKKEKKRQKNNPAMFKNLHSGNAEWERKPVWHRRRNNWWLPVRNPTRSAAAQSIHNLLLTKSANSWRNLQFDSRAENRK